MDAKIHYCHPGYVPSAPKTFLVAFSEDPALQSVKFKILDGDSREVYKGETEKSFRCAYTGEYLYKGFFTALGRRLGCPSSSRNQRRQCGRRV